MRRVLTAALAVMAIGTGLARAQEAGPEPVPRITVTGEGTETRAPDMATLQMGVTAEAKEASEAVQQTAEAMSDVLGVLNEAGIEGRDVQTSQLTLYPVREGRTPDDRAPPIVGFQATNRLTVRVRDLSKLGSVLDAVVSDGANTFDGLSFGLQDPEPARDAARRAAVADALRKAKLYADAAGVELGPIRTITEGGVSDPGPMPMMMEARSSMPVAEGEISYSATVRMEFAIGE